MKLPMHLRQIGQNWSLLWGSGRLWNFWRVKLNHDVADNAMRSIERTSFYILWFNRTPFYHHAPPPSFPYFLTPNPPLSSQLCIYLCVQLHHLIISRPCPSFCSRKFIQLYFSLYIYLSPFLKQIQIHCSKGNFVPNPVS